uniref:Uncharacterized protein n=1 Tax=Oryza punctata TaxID=4537 RepID=A0A0E0KX09_ORYPU
MRMRLPDCCASIAALINPLAAPDSGVNRSPGLAHSARRSSFDGQGKTYRVPTSSIYEDGINQRNICLFARLNR